MSHQLPTNEPDSLGWLFGRINYERSTAIPYHEQGMKLGRMRELLRRLGNPQTGLRIIHIAGTKGKGSTGAMIAAALQAAGMRIGVYSSPHLERFEERIAVDGNPCSTEDLVRLVGRVRPVATAMDSESPSGGPTFFDLATAMALVHFANVRADAVVLEVGLGGRLDSTNVCTPVVTVVTSISFDHTQQLGETLALIAAEKAGIFKPRIPAVSGVVDLEAAEVIDRQANVFDCPLVRRGRDFYMTDSEEQGWRFTRQTDTGEKHLEGIRPAMPGRTQVDNAAVALATLGVLRDQGWDLPDEACLTGIQTAKLPGRAERFEGSPTVVLDSAHNGASAVALAEVLEQTTENATERTLVLAIAEDKDPAAVIVPLVGLFGRVIVTRFVENPRSMDPVRLAGLVTEHSAGKNVKTQVLATPADAWCEAVRETDPAGVVVVAGSFFLVAEVRRLLLAERSAS